MSSPPSPPVPRTPSPVIPGAWPDPISTESSTPDSNQNLNRIVSFHKRFSLSFASPILMPSHSPLLGFSISGSGSTGLAVGPQHDTATSLSALADESISTCYSSDSAHEAVPRIEQPLFHLPEPISASGAPLNTYASPIINRNQHHFSPLPTPIEKSPDIFRTFSHVSRQPPFPHPTLSAHKLFKADQSRTENTENLTAEIADSPLALPYTPPSPATPASLGPIVFASPSSSSFALSTPFPSWDLLATTESDSLRNRPQLLSVRNNPPEHLSSSICAKDRCDIKNLRDLPESSINSHQLLSTIQTATPLSSNRSHTLALALSRPAHTRASSTSLLTPTRSSFNSISVLPHSSPHTTSRTSFPSRSPSPSPAPARPSYSRTRSSSAALFRSISSRSRTTVSGSLHTSDANVIAAEQPQPSFETTLSSENTGGSDTAEAYGTGADTEMGDQNVSVEGNEIEENLSGVQILELREDKRLCRLMQRGMKRFGAKVRKLVHAVSSLLPPAGVRDETCVEVRVDVTDPHDVVARQSPTSSRPNLAHKGLARGERSKRRPQPLRLPSLFPFVQSPSLANQPPFIVPVIHVSSADPPGLSRPIPGLPDDSMTRTPSAEPSPTLTLQVEPKARARAKLDGTGECGNASKAAASQVKNCTEFDDRTRERTTPFGFIGGKGRYW